MATPLYSASWEYATAPFGSVNTGAGSAPAEFTLYHTDDQPNATPPCAAAVHPEVAVVVVNDALLPFEPTQATSRFPEPVVAPNAGDPLAAIEPWLTSAITGRPRQEIWSWPVMSTGISGLSVTFV